MSAWPDFETIQSAARDKAVKADAESIASEFEGALPEMDSKTLDRINHSIWVELAERNKVYDYSNEPF